MERKRAAKVQRTFQQSTLPRCSVFASHARHGVRPVRKQRRETPDLHLIAGPSDKTPSTAARSTFRTAANRYRVTGRIRTELTKDGNGTLSYRATCAHTCTSPRFSSSPMVSTANRFRKRKRPEFMQVQSLSRGQKMQRGINLLHFLQMKSSDGLLAQSSTPSG